MSDSMRVQKNYSIEAQIDWAARQVRRLQGALPKPKPSEAEFDSVVGTNVLETLCWVRNNRDAIIAYVAYTKAKAKDQS